MSIPALSIFFRAAFVLAAGSLLPPACMKTYAPEVRQLVSQRLHPGDSPDAIVQFLKDYKIDYNFDATLHRYEGGYPIPKAELDRGHCLSVDIYVDKKGSFLRAEVVDKLHWTMKRERVPNQSSKPTLAGRQSG